MTRISAMALMLCALASTLGAADVTDADILNLVLRDIPRVTVIRSMEPAILSNVTRGGAEDFAGEWIRKRRGEVIGGEIASAYVEQGRTAEPVAASANFQVADVRPFEHGENYDWEKLNLQFPGVKSVIVVSKPVFDRLGSFAFVRVDMIGRGHDFTQFYDLERQLDGSWKVVVVSMGSFEMMHRQDVRLSPGR